MIKEGLNQTKSWAFKVRNIESRVHQISLCPMDRVDDEKKRAALMFTLSLTSLSASTFKNKVKPC